MFPHKRAFRRNAPPTERFIPTECTDSVGGSFSTERYIPNPSSAVGQKIKNFKIFFVNLVKFYFSIFLLYFLPLKIPFRNRNKYDFITDLSYGY
jgi:hypothetical protein